MTANRETFPFRVKICGVSTGDSVAAVAASGADAVGLNYYSGSARYLDPDRESMVLESLEESKLVRVGVFVDEARAEIESHVDRASLDFIQLHGDEPLSLIADLPAGRVIRALRCRDEGLAEVQEATDALATAALPIAAILLDAYDPFEKGGTGRTLKWDQLAEWRTWSPFPLILAGGLNAQNVAQAIDIVRPAGVDTASGVEEQGYPGVKWPQACREFVAAARARLDAIIPE